MPLSDQDMTIKHVRVYTVSGDGGGDYFRQKRGHWLIDSIIANPMSGYSKYQASRASWGVSILESIVVEIETQTGIKGVATGFGGVLAGWLINHHFNRFLIGADARQVNLLWDQMFRSSLYYGRKGIPIAAISVVDLALWDLIGKARSEPVYNLIGGLCQKEINFYCTGPSPESAKKLGFWGGKVPLPYGPHAGQEGLDKNYEFLKAHREAIGPDFPLMVDCYMALSVPYAIELAEKCMDLNIYWWEEVLHPDDIEGFQRIKQAHPKLKWTTGEHEYTRYGFRRLIEDRLIDILQPDVMWVGGLTETLRIAAHAAAYDLPVVPHGSGPYSYHFIAAQPGSPFCEYVASSADGQEILPVFGKLFHGEPLPQHGKLQIPNTPGFGMELADRSALCEISAQTPL